MDDDARIQELADRWEAANREGQSIAPEDLCRDCPELFDAVNEKIKDRKLGAEFEKWAGVGSQQSAASLFSLRERPAPQHGIGDKFGRYELVEFLGAGGYGEVWRASDPEIDRDVAIKIMPRGERSLEEAKKIGQLKHQNIVRVYDVGHKDEEPYIVSELIDGRSLATLLEQQRQSFDEAVRIAAAVADALHHAHSHGFIHRDVKPANILLDQGRKVFLADFGLAVSAEQSLDPEDATLGTPAYKSPEQVRRLGLRSRNNRLR